MKRTEDDARNNPKIGDRLKKGREEREVVNVWCNTLIVCQSRINGRESLFGVSPYLAQWRKWAAKAEVLEVSE